MTISRNNERRQTARRVLIATLVGSLIAHALLVALLVPGWLEKMNEPPEPPDEPLEIVAQYEEEEPEPLPEPKPEPEEVVQPQPQPQKPAEQPEYEPEVADNAPSAAMMVASREPTPEPADPPPPAEPEVEETSPPEPVEPEATPPDPVPEEENSPVILEKPKLDPKKAFMMPSMQSYNQMFAQQDEVARKRAKELQKGKRLFKNYEKTTAAVRESLTTFGREVTPGNHTGVDPHSRAFGSYVGMIHNKIHVRWANGYLMDLDLKEPAGSPMNNPELNTKIEFIIRASDGEIEKINIVKSSGQVRFDAQAVAIAHSTGPHPGAPEELVSPDGKVYMHWNFWRDQRQCGVFGATVFIVAEQGGSPG